MGPPHISRDVGPPYTKPHITRYIGPTYSDIHHPSIRWNHFCVPGSYSSWYVYLFQMRGNYTLADNVCWVFLSRLPWSQPEPFKEPGCTKMHRHRAANALNIICSQVYSRHWLNKFWQWCLSTFYNMNFVTSCLWTIIPFQLRLRLRHPLTNDTQLWTLQGTRSAHECINIVLAYLNSARHGYFLRDWQSIMALPLRSTSASLGNFSWPERGWIYITGGP